MFELSAAKLMLNTIWSPAWGVGGKTSTPITAQSVILTKVELTVGMVLVPVKMNVKLGKNVNMLVDDVTVMNVKVKLGWKVKLGKKVKVGLA